MTEFHYKAAQEELEEILHQLESGETDLDELTSKVKRACELITLCQDKLRVTEEEIKTYLQ
ncbi:MAG: exodeoxyribonuclease VII small subunit [Nitrosopumilus sp.]|nr:exodeoxyribonuclease VII small subunit [Nitrosopumilus sp.]